MNTPRILIIDDDVQVCETIASLINRKGLQSRIAHNIVDGLNVLENEYIDIVFLDVRLPDGNGLDALERINQSPSNPEVIILTGLGDPDGAETAIQRGVWDYLVKPSPIKQIKFTLQQALQYRAAKAPQTAPPTLELEGIIGSTEIMHQCYNLITKAALSSANVLLTGETGTGKELFARTIHRNSELKNGPFVVVDCASLTETLVESTLFGHVKGAFTHAMQDQDGLVKLADQGTLFLDEVGELPLSIQRSFLRFLQEHTFRPVGGSKEIHSNFRLISATNRDLDAMTERGEFRKDLLYRLKTIQLNLPPLRERPEDIKALAVYFSSKMCARNAVPTKGFSQDFFDTLRLYDWPGNIRELSNVIERTVLLAGQQNVLYAMHLPREIRAKAARVSLAKPSGEGGEAEKNPAQSTEEYTALIDSGLKGHMMSFKDFKKEIELAYLQKLFNQTQGDVTEMLKISGLSRSHFYALLKKYGITE